ncbi:LamG domain-containing protein [Candidatus Parvarchaeota archaeon]|nr:LamG domain-containing protein [Candidatus Parvarchaeota archaeon]
MSRSQSALEYMMTYGWAILIIVIVAAVLYSLGIFSPSSSISATVTGFSNLGSVAAQCTSNGVLRLSLGDSTGYPINVTSITAKDSSTSQTSTFKPNSTVDPNPIIDVGGSYIFSVPNVCPPAGSHYSISTTVNYTEPGQPLPGPYFSVGTITGITIPIDLPEYVATFSSSSSRINTSAIPFRNQSFSITFWVYLKTYNSSCPYGCESKAFTLSSFQGCTGSSCQILGFDTRGNNFHYFVWDADLYEPSTAGKWYFISWTFSNPSKTQTGYIDGASPVGNGVYISNPTYLFIGDGPVLGGGSLDGFITNFQIYNSTLTQSQIASLYQEGLDYTPVPSTGLAQWWPLNGTIKNYAQNIIPANNGVVFTSNYPSTGLP